MNIVEKIMSWFGGKVVPLEEAQKRMPNHEPEEKEVVMETKLEQLPRN